MNVFFRNSICVFASALCFYACSDDSSTSSNVERNEGSFSEVESSSSATDQSSSSVDADLPKGARLATLDDLEKNMSLGELFGTTAYLATGAKHDVYSIWVPDTAWIAFYSEFKEGTITFGNSNGYYAGIDGDDVTTAVGELWQTGGTIKFIVNSDSLLQYSLNGSDYVTMESAKVAVSGNTLSDGDKLKGLKLECKYGDEKDYYYFYEGRFLQKISVDSSDAWTAGYYDIQRSRLFLIPAFYNSDSYIPLSTMIVDSDYNITSVTGESYECSEADFDYETIEATEIAGDWVAEDDGYDWTLSLNNDGSYQMDAKKAGVTEELKSGVWDIYGNLLLVRNTQCLNPTECVRAANGVVSNFDPETGFDFDHSDDGTPEVPKTWTVQQYE